MNMKAREISSSSTDNASLDQSDADAITDILLGDEREEDDIDDISEDTDDADGADTGDEEEAEEPADESTDEVDESDDDSDDLTWESALGLDEGQLDYDEEGNISGVNIKVNDKSSTVDMKDLILGYQNNKSFTQKSQALAGERKEFDTQIATVKQDYKAKLDSVEQLTNYLGDKLVQEFEGINWEQLRVEKPAEYAAAKLDYSAKAQELKQAQEAIFQEKNVQTEENNAERVKTRQKHMKIQFEQMITNNPTWSNPKTLEKDMGDLRSFANSKYGFSDSDFKAVSDSRIIEVLKDAKAFRDGVKVAKTKRKKPVPKFQKSGKGSSRKRSSKLDNLTKRAKDAKGASKRDAQSSAIAELLKDGVQ